MVKEIDCFKREGTRVEAIFKNFSDLTNDLGLVYIIADSYFCFYFCIYSWLKLKKISTLIP